MGRSKIPFLEITEEDIRISAQTNIVAATAFSQAAIRAFLSKGDEKDVGGTLIFTGATSAWRGKEEFAAFAAGKHGLRAISQVRPSSLSLSSSPPSPATLLRHFNPVLTPPFPVHRSRVRTSGRPLGFRRS